jgi:CRP-like cAMP-binding protein
MNPEELKQIAVLQAMDGVALAQLAGVLEEKDYADGQAVFAEGDPGDSMFFLVKGCIRIEKRAQATSAVHKTLAVLEAGDYFGEMALLDQKPRSASAWRRGTSSSSASRSRRSINCRSGAARRAWACSSP